MTVTDDGHAAWAEYGRKAGLEPVSPLTMGAVTGLPLLMMASTLPPGIFGSLIGISGSTMLMRTCGYYLADRMSQRRTRKRK